MEHKLIPNPKHFIQPECKYTFALCPNQHILYGDDSYQMYNIVIKTLKERCGNDVIDSILNSMYTNIEQNV